MSQPDGRLYRSYKDGQARFNAYLEDYAALSRGLIALYESTFDLRWLGEAARLTQLMFEQFHDAAGGGFFQTGVDHEQLVARRKDFVDNAIPSGNALAAETLLRLAVLLDKEAYRRRGGAHPADDEGCHGAPAHRFWPAAGRAGRVPGALQEVAIVGDPADAATMALLTEVRRRYLPHTVVALARPGEESMLPLLARRGWWTANRRPMSVRIMRASCR
jgi:uncharacterized protein YyaL (SSP411 family)